MQERSFHFKVPRPGVQPEVDLRVYDTARRGWLEVSRCERSFRRFDFTFLPLLTLAGLTDIVVPALSPGLTIIDLVNYAAACWCAYTLRRIVPSAVRRRRAFRRFAHVARAAGLTR